MHELTEKCCGHFVNGWSCLEADKIITKWLSEKAKLIALQARMAKGSNLVLLDTWVSEILGLSQKETEKKCSCMSTRTYESGVCSKCGLPSPEKKPTALPEKFDSSDAFYQRDFHIKINQIIDFLREKEER